MSDIVERATIRAKRLPPESVYDARLLLECCVEIGRLRRALQARGDGEAFCLVPDNDCHWYVIPADRREAFSDWVRCQEEGRPMETDLEPERVNGAPCRVKFKQWEIA